MRKLFSFFSILFQFNIRFNQYNAFLKKGSEILDSTNIDLILVTGGPFPLFKVANNLSSRYKIPWIIDFRDTWSLSKSRNRNILFKIINKYQESKAINSASDIITVSDGLCTNVTAKATTQIKPHNLFIDNSPSFSAKNCFITLV